MAALLRDTRALEPERDRGPDHQHGNPQSAASREGGQTAACTAVPIADWVKDAKAKIEGPRPAGFRQLASTDGVELHIARLLVEGGLGRTKLVRAGRRSCQIGQVATPCFCRRHRVRSALPKVRPGARRDCAERRIESDESFCRIASRLPAAL